MASLTVLAPKNDPFRRDTKAGHRDGAWLADTAAELGLLTDRPRHVRGLHYAVLGRTKPNGLQYKNNDKDDDWLALAAKCARWLGYVGFEQVVDHRNDVPEVRLFDPRNPLPYLSAGLHIEIPDVVDLMPQVGLFDFDGIQPYRIVMVGEKSSLDDTLAPVALQYEADLYLPTGEISETLAHQMAKIAAEDGRPMAILYFSDADPSGWQMPISLARKLQAFQALGYVFDFEIHRAALTPQQAIAYGLPSTPLKDTEKRADAWESAWGVEQTEIDALASLRPEVLRRIAEDAILPFFDTTLAERVNVARQEWLTAAQEVITDALGVDHLAQIQADAAVKLAQIQADIDRVNESFQMDIGDFDLPEPMVPTAELTDENYGVPLVHSRWSFHDQCNALIDSKAYR